ncbi:MULTISPECIES: hypothetical protein [unclassified Streptomyces]|uniref:hypothetical protein n=1 Tax=unclassified Streptomyces TaxID=2593676 RepID=UPI002DDC23A1|nr:hypothetical protein [Streptomyces sp. NBC_01750]WSB02712.1 hypothetical protein OIE54_27620 [Streptomyces sp. NBC_01794]WSD33015.1 hypothetical protein OG966_14500 [Streptomyces sp. NBC_01750]
MSTKRRSAGTVKTLAPMLVLVLAVALTAACRQAAGGTRPAGGTGIGSPTVTPYGYGLVFLGPGDCGSRGRDFSEVPCTSEKAAARVIARYGGRPSAGPACPVATDFVLHISESRPAADEDGDGEVGQGYACMRNLEPPHPGDPGGGGGPHTVVGDCVRDASNGQVKETACDGSGTRAPEFEVASAVVHRSQCPPSTALYVQLGGERPVGCARRV